MGSDRRRRQTAIHSQPAHASRLCKGLQSVFRLVRSTADQRALNVVPALIADLGDEAAWRYVEFVL
jgi:hypothetical protein